MRLTRKQKFIFAIGKNGEVKEQEAIIIDNHKSGEEKLCQLEDIEEEFEIDLITFFKEIKDTRIEGFIREIIAAIKRRRENGKHNRDH